MQGNGIPFSWTHLAKLMVTRLLEKVREPNRRRRNNIINNINNNNNNNNEDTR
jgi:hypothetical protein